MFFVFALFFFVINICYNFAQAPADGVTGGLCPAGGYCPVGSAWPANCPLGTYSNSSGSKTPDDCIACDPG